MGRIIDIEHFEGGPLRFDEAVSPTPYGSTPTDPVEVLTARMRAEADRGPRGVDLRGRLAATVRMQCSRCLEPVELPIETDFFLTLVAEEPESLPGESETDPEDACLYQATDGKVSVDEIAAEQVALNLPLKVVCREGCLGLCPTCGANRNDLQCGCADEAIDPRLAPLAEMKKRLGES